MLESDTRSNRHRAKTEGLSLRPPPGSKVTDKFPSRLYAIGMYSTLTLITPIFALLFLTFGTWSLAVRGLKTTPPL